MTILEAEIGAAFRAGQQAFRHGIKLPALAPPSNEDLEDLRAAFVAGWLRMKEARERVR